jgi:hypothetical protein
VHWRQMRLRNHTLTSPVIGVRACSCTQMLSSVEHFTQHLDGRQQLDVPTTSKLCEKKDMIISKFDQLLKKLIGDDQTLNMTGC